MGKGRASAGHIGDLSRKLRWEALKACTQDRARGVDCGCDKGDSRGGPCAEGLEPHSRLPSL